MKPVRLPLNVNLDTDFSVGADETHLESQHSLLSWFCLLLVPQQDPSQIYVHSLL